MRTRLDEIVEEESRADSASGWALRIAERAFRHGVERTNEVTRQLLAGSGVVFSLWTVQPAPAGEKSVGLGTVKHNGCTGCRCMRTIDPKYPSSLWICGCDRKGERRKDFEAHSTFRPSDGGFVKAIYLPPFGAAGWVEDRRSGKDRRKP